MEKERRVFGSEVLDLIHETGCKAGTRAKGQICYTGQNRSGNYQFVCFMHCEDLCNQKDSPRVRLHGKPKIRRNVTLICK